jgi:DNA-binding MarR family transcriptional regulator
MVLSNKEYVQINQALFSISNAYESRMLKDKELQQTGLLLSDRAVLMVLGQLAPLNSRQLADIMAITPGTISVYIQRLVEKGLVVKTQDQNDRRNWLLHLTEEGQAHYSQTISGTVSYTQKFLTPLSEDEQRRLHQMLLKVSHSLGFDWQ